MERRAIRRVELVTLIYIGPEPYGALDDERQGKSVPYVRGYKSRVSKELAEEILETGYWLKTKEH